MEAVDPIDLRKLLPTGMGHQRSLHLAPPGVGRDSLDLEKRLPAAGATRLLQSGIPRLLEAAVIPHDPGHVKIWWDVGCHHDVMPLLFQKSRTHF